MTTIDCRIHTDEANAPLIRHHTCAEALLRP